MASEVLHPGIYTELLPLHSPCTFFFFFWTWTNPYTWPAYYHWKESLNQATGSAWSSCHLYPTFWSPLVIIYQFPLKSYSNLCLPWLLRTSALLTTFFLILCSPVTITCNYLVVSRSHSSESSFRLRSFYSHILFKVPILRLLFIPSLHSFLGYLHSKSNSKISYQTMEDHR